MAWAIARPMYMPDYVRAFEGLGFSMELIDRREVTARLGAGEKPRFILDSTPRCPTHDDARDAGVCIVGLPLDQWYHSPRLSLPRYEQRRAEHLIFTLAPEQVEPYRAAGYPHVEHLPFGVDIDRFNPEPLSTEKVTRFDTDICFIGSSLRNHSPPDSFSETVLANPDNTELHQWLEELASRVIYFDYRMPDLLMQMEKDTGIYLGASAEMTPDKETWCIRAGIRIAEMERLEVVRTLSQFRFALYGTEDWLEQLQGQDAVSHYRGEVSWEYELPVAMKAAQINVNVSKAMFLTGIAPRIYETLACGKLLLSNPIPAVMAAFEDGKEIVIYRSLEDLAEKCRYYLAHTDEAARIGRAGRDKVTAQHSTRHRAERIASVLEERGIL